MRLCCSAWAAKACWCPAAMPLTIGIRRHGQSKAVPGGAISARTEPKTHSPAAAAAHSPAEAPEPIFVLFSLFSQFLQSHLCSTVIESNPARAGADRELSCGAGELPESETRLRHLSHFQDSVRSPRRIRNAAATESDPDAAAITLETPYTGSSSRPLQSPFGPYPYLAAAAATSRSFGGGSAETKSLQLTFACRRWCGILGPSAHAPLKQRFGSKIPLFAIQCDQALASVPAVSRPA